MTESVAGRPTATRPSEILLFHSVLGVRPAIHEFAEALRGAGHVVHVADLYDGHVFDDYEPALAFMESIGGVPALMERTVAAASEFPDATVFIGFSNGGASAELLALSNPATRGVVLLHAALPVEALGATAWPVGVPVQVHYATRDPWKEPDMLHALRESVLAANAPWMLYEYDLAAHLFADAELTQEYDAEAAELMTARVLNYLSGLS